MRICFDLDGVIATVVPDGNYDNAEPLWNTIRFINYLHEKGHTIIIATARGFVSKKDWRELTLKQLSTWGVHFDEFRMDKVGADYYVDDKSVSLSLLMHMFKEDRQSLVSAVEEKGNEEDEKTIKRTV